MFIANYLTNVDKNYHYENFKRADVNKELKTKAVNAWNQRLQECQAFTRGCYFTATLLSVASLALASQPALLAMRVLIPSAGLLGTTLLVNLLAIRILWKIAKEAAVEKKCCELHPLPAPYDPKWEIVQGNIASKTRTISKAAQQHIELIVTNIQQIRYTYNQWKTTKEAFPSDSDNVNFTIQDLNPGDCIEFAIQWKDGTWATKPGDNFKILIS
jgi:hypothetical protein